MKGFLKLLVIVSCFFLTTSIFAFAHGIYITESTVMHTDKLQNLIDQSKKYGIDTFIIDVNVLPGKRFSANVKKVLDAGIHFVARIVVFPRGATHAQVTNKAIWAKKLALAKAAVNLGASAIQLDYIRYEASYPPNQEKAKQVLKVVQYFKNELEPYKGVTLQMDIFGIAALKPADTIGQNPAMLAGTVNAFCPMVYPSHFEPFRVHSVRPYETIYHAITSLKKQLPNDSNVAIYAYIEAYNYRFMMSHAKKLEYIAAEMKAAHDAGSNGWYVWSPNNRYASLFEVLANKSQARAQR